MLIAIEQNPQWLEEMDMDDKRPPLTIPKPMELAGMRSRLLRSQAQQKDLTQIGKDYDAVMDGIDDAKGALKGHVGDLKLYEGAVRNTIESMIDRSNGGDPLDEGEKTGQSGQTSLGAGQGQANTGDVPKDAETVAPGDVGKVEGVLAQGQQEAEPLTVNGVSKT